MDVNVKMILDLVHQHQLAAATLAFLGTGLGASLLARVINVIPMGWWYGTVWGIFRALSIGGNHKLGRFVWKPIEGALDRLIFKTADSAREGLHSDDEAEAADGAAAPPADKKSLELEADKTSPLQPQPPAPPANPPS